MNQTSVEFLNVKDVIDKYNYLIDNLVNERDALLERLRAAEADKAKVEETKVEVKEVL